MSLPILLAAGLALLTLFVVRRAAAYFRLAHVPGPRFAGWSRLPLVLDNLTGRHHEILYEYNLKYGPLVRLAPNILITCDADVYQRMYAPNSKYRRAPYYGVFRFKPRSDNLFSTIDEARHNAVRRKMAPGYAGREVPYMEDDIDKHVQEWVNLIERKYISDDREVKKMDIGRQAQFFTLDVISELAFNHSFGDLVDDNDNFRYVQTAEETVSVMTMLSYFPSVHGWLEQSRVMDLIAPNAVDKLGLGAVIGVAKQRIAERFDDYENQKDKQDMLGSFLRHGLSQTDAEGETVLQIIAGADTSATIMRVVLLYVLSSPAIYNKLINEIDVGIKEGRISSPIKDAEARRLPYLQGCIKEALRLWPVVVGISLKQVPDEGDEVCGYKIPGGTFIGHNAWAFGREEAVYGPDFEVYRPERWIEASGRRLELMERNKEFTFGYGRFKCLGQPVAFMELNKVFVELLRRFNISILNPAKPLKSTSHGIFLQSDFFVKVTRRPQEL
ncbi:uncharacterized protein PV09_01052 [Verruconis gallopava]|uniref:Cytochrome P450 n=1 Tax=Verruconis gallopava TaxID=253628 RepID=A0A0D1Z566_9PEZI|nr:uncharacterized protein PV09_01052 [Verruconis gallopava]KIW08117.1 hypothetical protein PV09_01052 [Verruconis gallopava]